MNLGKYPIGWGYSPALGGWQGHVFGRKRKGRGVLVIGRTRVCPSEEEAKRRTTRLERTKRSPARTRGASIQPTLKPKSRIS